MGPEILKDHPFYTEMNFLPTKHVIGRLISYLITGALPNDAEHYEESMLIISEHLNEKAYFGQVKWHGISKKQPKSFKEQKGYSNQPEINLTIPPLPQPRKNLLKALDLFFDDRTSLLNAGNKITPLLSDINDHIKDMINMSSIRTLPDQVMTELEIRKEVMIFYQLEQILIEYQIALMSIVRRITLFIHEAEKYDVHQGDHLQLSECVTSKTPPP